MNGEPRLVDQPLLRDVQRDMADLAEVHGSDATLDLAFLSFLRRFSRFGFFTFGPVTIDVRLIEDLVDRTAPRGGSTGTRAFAEDYVRFTLLLMEEVRRSGRRRIDELHFLLAFMRTAEGLPGRVFGELAVSPADVESFAKGQGASPPPAGHAAPASVPAPERLYSPEEAAEYLGVHVQTVRSWIRSGRLAARRLAGQRALRIRASDLESVLEPLTPNDV